MNGVTGDLHCALVRGSYLDALDNGNVLVAENNVLARDWVVDWGKGGREGQHVRLLERTSGRDRANARRRSRCMVL